MTVSVSLPCCLRLQLHAVKLTRQSMSLVPQQQRLIHLPSSDSFPVAPVQRARSSTWVSFAFTANVRNKQLQPKKGLVSLSDESIHQVYLCLVYDTSFTLFQYVSFKLLFFLTSFCFFCLVKHFELYLRLNFISILHSHKKVLSYKKVF